MNRIIFVHSEMIETIGLCDINTNYLYMTFFVNCSSQNREFVHMKPLSEPLSTIIRVRHTDFCSI